MAHSYLLAEGSWSACFEVAVDGVADDIADPAIVPVGDPLDGFVGLVVDAEVDALGVSGSAGERGTSGVAPDQGRRVEVGLGGQALLVVGVEAGSRLGDRLLGAVRRISGGGRLESVRMAGCLGCRTSFVLPARPLTRGRTRWPGRRRAWRGTRS